MKEHIHRQSNWKQEAVETNTGCAGAPFGKVLFHRGRIQNPSQWQQRDKYCQRGEWQKHGFQVCTGLQLGYSDFWSISSGFWSLLIIRASWGIRFGIPSIIGYAMPRSSLISSLVDSSYLQHKTEKNDNVFLSLPFLFLLFCFWIIQVYKASR